MGTVVILVVLMVVIAIAAVAFLALSGGGGAGDCVYIVDGITNRYPNYSAAECDAYCARVRYGSCYFSPYGILADGLG